MFLLPIIQVPHILGLTASPVMRSDPSSVTKIEETLDAICRTPTKHREELRLQVKLPVLSHVTYQPLMPESSLGSYTRTIDSLGQAFRNLKIVDDPYVISLLEENTERSRRKLEKIQINHKTWCQEQMKSFHATTLKICSEIGAWAADYYAFQVIARVKKSAKESGTSFGIWDVANAEKQYLAKALMSVDFAGYTACQTPASIPLVTDKVSKLVETLVRKSKSSGTFSAIVFVQGKLMSMSSICLHLWELGVQELFREPTCAFALGAWLLSFLAPSVHLGIVHTNSMIRKSVSGSARSPALSPSRNSRSLPYWDDSWRLGSQLPCSEYRGAY